MLYLLVLGLARKLLAAWNSGLPTEACYPDALIRLGFVVVEQETTTEPASDTTKIHQMAGRKIRA